MTTEAAPGWPPGPRSGRDRMTARALLATNREQRIDSRRSPGRDETRGERHQSEYSDDTREDQRVERLDLVQERRNRPTASSRGTESDDESNEDQSHALRDD